MTTATTAPGLLLDSPDVHRRFDAICTLISARGHGITLRDLAAAHSLAREEAADEPDGERVAELRLRLGLKASG